MLNEQKYKRWAWGALIGLAIIIVIAGIIMAMSAKTPKPNNELTADKASTSAVSGEKNEKTVKDSEETKKNNQETETKSETTNNGTQNQTGAQSGNTGSVNTPVQTTTPAQTTTPVATTTDNMPKTGPEDAIIPVLGLAIVGYLFAYNAALFKKNA